MESLRSSLYRMSDFAPSSDMQETDFSDVVHLLRNGFESGVLSSLDSRKNLIQSILKMLNENADAVFEACKKDLHRCRAETTSLDLGFSKKEARFMLANMHEWLRDEYVSRTFLSALDTPYIQRQPLGVVLIFGSWNFPFVSVFAPLIGALAAGNTAVIKPSENAPASSLLLSTIVPKYLDKNVCQVICGGLEVCQNLLALRFDHIFYTGGTVGARAIYTAAANFLTPVTLELGGKCPSYVDAESDLQLAARRIAWGKIYNAGQACVGVDYVLLHSAVASEFYKHLEDSLLTFLGKDPQKSPDFARIVNEKHFKRLVSLLRETNGTITVGGTTDEEDLYISPTVVVDVQPNDSLMSEEIFGPILPIMKVDSAEEAVNYIRSKEKPLACYVFTRNADVFSLFKQNTSSGSLTQNGCCTHFVASELPFGGVGASGIGRYHGKFSLDTFSHLRGVLIKSTNELVNQRAIYPPYTEGKIAWTEWLLSGSDRRFCSIL